ncbi:mechanosensitive ion channel family protein [Abyssalbus ytuae]|uniref:Mechanosensitive ion channel n=1 Tax=Abyssalbus ytuae TaxID=2926907 RepID=A0A9E6ZV22_9FLAO|nr:mechanosensitive ion channel domain-containing protein [Abyssalbus ytuae]UOB18313.1 mechanosensitive ion channel [Abyssalbus ytuae]
MEEIEDIKDSLLDKIKDFLDLIVYNNNDDSVQITIGLILLVIVIFIITSLVLRGIRRLVTKKLPYEDKIKFTSIFSFAKWFIYVIVLLIVFDSVGINVTAIFAASAALLVGIGLALQTFFQDILAGIFILIDQTVHVGDIIEIDGKVGRVTSIHLRTTRAVTLDNKVLIIPNHKYLTSILFNWTQNDVITRESITVGVAYGSNVEMVKELLLQAAKSHEKILKDPEPSVMFSDFGDSALIFKLWFTINDSFTRFSIQSDLRFEVDKLFRENNITIPFPQRDIHIFQQKSE